MESRHRGRQHQATQFGEYNVLLQIFRQLKDAVIGFERPMKSAVKSQRSIISGIATLRPEGGTVCHLQILECGIFIDMSICVLGIQIQLGHAYSTNIVFCNLKV